MTVTVSLAREPPVTAAWLTRSLSLTLPSLHQGLGLGLPGLGLQIRVGPYWKRYSAAARV